MENKRASFGKISGVLVAAGSAVGLGNIWRFPYVAGENGGGAFLLIYIACILLMGIPLMIAEFSVGASTHLNAVGAYRSLDRRWSFLGYMGVLTSVIIMGFYLVVAGWTAEYTVHSFTSDLVRQNDPTLHAEAFNAFITHPWKPIIYTLLFALGTHAIVVLGVKKGIERASKLMMPLLLIFLVVLAIHSILLPGGMEGLKFLLKPDFGKVTTSTFLTALGQAFFSLSIGLGTMVTYASYFKPGTRVQHTALEVSILDTVVAVLAGLMIFPAVFSAGIEPQAGPSLVFITLPSIFSTMPMSELWSTLFFLLLVIAALTSTISIHETITAYVEEEWRVSRRVAAWISTTTTALLGILASLSLGVLHEWTICGLTIFDSMDYVTANILLPAGGLLACLFVAWRFDRKRFAEQLHPDGHFGKTYHLMRFLLRYTAPILIILIFLDNLGII